MDAKDFKEAVKASEGRVVTAEVIVTALRGASSWARGS